MRAHGAILACLCGLAGGAQAQRTADEAKALLVAGNERFTTGRSIATAMGPGARRSLVRGENPYAIVLCCADSQVPPEHVFNAGLGDLFVVRVAGNCVDREAIASIEYAAEQLGTQLCVVLGHDGCGAIAAATELFALAAAGRPVAAASPAQQQLLDALQPAVRSAAAQDLGGKDLTDRAEAENAQAMAVECVRRSPLLQHLQKLDRFTVLPARYHLDTGEVEWLPPRPLPPPPLAAPAARAAAPSMAPQVALRLLQAGHRRFLGDGRPIGDIGADRRADLTLGQQPTAIVVTCADSRVVPEHLFDAGLGELFVVRVAGNVVNDDVLASIEFAATRCGTPLLVVLGHSACAAVTAAVEHGDDQTLGPNARALVDRLQPAVERARRDGQGGDGLVAAATRCNAQLFVAQARQQSAILRDLERSGRFLMLAAVYDLADGDIEWLAEAPERAAAPPAQPTQPIEPPTPAPAGETAPAPDHAPEEPAAAPPPAPDRASGPAGPGDGMQPDAAVATSPEPTPPVATTAPPAAATETHAAAPAPVEDREHVRLPFSPTELLAMVGIAALVLAALLSLRPRV